jgi:hypothetical protein
MIFLSWSKRINIIKWSTHIVHTLIHFALWWHGTTVRVSNAASDVSKSMFNCGTGNLFYSFKTFINIPWWLVIPESSCVFNIFPEFWSNATLQIPAGTRGAQEGRTDGCSVKQIQRRKQNVHQYNEQLERQDLSNKWLTSDPGSKLEEGLWVNRERE